MRTDFTRYRHAARKVVSTPPTRCRMLFETGMLNRPKIRTHRRRSGDDKRESGTNGGSTDGEQSHGDESSGGGGSEHAVARRGRGRLDRDQRETSSSSSGGSAESPGLSWDPHVAAVLFRMHREMQHIGRQLDMLENILVNQQRLLRIALNQSLNVSIVASLLHLPLLLLHLCLTRSPSGEPLPAVVLQEYALEDYHFHSRVALFCQLSYPFYISPRRQVGFNVAFLSLCTQPISVNLFRNGPKLPLRAKVL